MEIFAKALATASDREQAEFLNLFSSYLKLAYLNLPSTQIESVVSKLNHAACDVLSQFHVAIEVEKKIREEQARQIQRETETIEALERQRKNIEHEIAVLEMKRIEMEHEG